MNSFRAETSMALVLGHPMNDRPQDFSGFSPHGRLHVVYFRIMTTTVINLFAEIWESYLGRLLIVLAAAGGCGAFVLAKLAAVMVH